MATTAAERQKEYREGIKKKDPDFLKQERERAKHYRKPMKSLPVKEQKLRRQRNRKYASTFREKVKRQKQNTVNITLHSPERTMAISDTSTSALTILYTNNVQQGQRPTRCLSRCIFQIRKVKTTPSKEVKS